MKKSSIIISIISYILIALGAIFLLLTPVFLKDGGNYTGASDVSGVLSVILNGTLSNIQSLFKPEFYSTSALLYFLPALLVVLLVLWLIHLIALIVKKRGNAFVLGLLGLIFGFVGFLLIDMLISPYWWFAGETKNVFGYIQAQNAASEGGLGVLKTLLVVLPYILGAVGFVLVLAFYIISIVDVNKNPGQKKNKRDGGTLVEPLYDASDAQSDAEAREIAKSELKDETVASAPVASVAPTPTVISKDGYTGSSPTIVQYIYNNGSNPAPCGDRPFTKDDIRSIIAEELGKKSDSVDSSVQAIDEDDLMTTDDLRSIIREEVNKGNEPVSSETIEEPVPEDDGSEILTSDDLRKIIREELSSSLGSDDVVADEAEASDEAAPVEDTSEEESDVLTSDDLRKIIAEEMKKAIGTGDEEETEVKEEDEEGEIATTDDLRSIIRDELSSQSAPEAPVVEEEKEDVTPLTANDLRTLIQEALDEHDNPERRELTEDEARNIIVEQIRSYYATKKEEEKADSKALKEKEAAESKAKEEEARRLALEKKLEEEIAAREKERAEREADRKERLESEKSRETVSLEDIRTIIHGELSSYKPTLVTSEKAEKVDEKGIKDIIRTELAGFREEQAKANEQSAQEAMDAHLIEQARAEAQAEESKAQSEEIKNLKANAVTSDDVRSIIAEELDKRFAALLKAQEENKKAVETLAKKEPAKEEANQALEEKKETIVIEVKEPEESKKAKAKETPKVVAATKKEEPAKEDKTKIVRIPFNERMLAADKETMDNYNELKAECISYGLKSRLSNSGDTFRLHTKTYVKIVVAGKGLKLYLALDPKAYENNPIPLHDAGHKNIYKDIPGVFKVKSALSLRRAKQLIADACEHDGLEQGKIVPHNYVKELKDYVPQLGKKDDVDTDEDED